MSASIGAGASPVSHKAGCDLKMKQKRLHRQSLVRICFAQLVDRYLTTPRKSLPEPIVSLGRKYGDIIPTHISLRPRARMVARSVACSGINSRHRRRRVYVQPSRRYRQYCPRFQLSLPCLPSHRSEVHFCPPWLPAVSAMLSLGRSGDLYDLR